MSSISARGQTESLSSCNTEEKWSDRRRIAVSARGQTESCLSSCNTEEKWSDMRRITDYSYISEDTATFERSRKIPNVNNAEKEVDEISPCCEKRVSCGENENSDGTSASSEKTPVGQDVQSYCSKLVDEQRCQTDAEYRNAMEYLSSSPEPQAQTGGKISYSEAMSLLVGGEVSCQMSDSHMCSETSATESTESLVIGDLFPIASLFAETQPSFVKCGTYESLDSSWPSSSRTNLDPSITSLYPCPPKRREAEYSDSSFPEMCWKRNSLLENDLADRNQNMTVAEDGETVLYCELTAAGQPVLCKQPSAEKSAPVFFS